MSRVLTLLQEYKEDKHNTCKCLTKMLNLKGTEINGCEIFEKILEENKENINFVFDKYSDEGHKKHGNKYADFINKYHNEVTHAMCLECLWHVITNYNEIPIGDKILCYN